MPQAVQVQVPEYLDRRERSKRSERVIQGVALTAAVLCVAIGSLFVEPIDKMRLEHQLTLDPESTKGLPPDISLLTKTGTFRAIAIDFAFMRLERLKQENKYYELNKLSTLICKLAPRFPSVWKYAAWNQTYNISVTQYTPEGRWYWVNKGIELLRNEGLRYNEKSIGLYLELAWIFWHKVGDFLDDQHWTYKKELAVEMERLLGPRPPTMESEEIVDHFAQVAHARGSLNALLAEDPEVAHLVDELVALDLQPDPNLLDFVARHLRSGIQIEDVLKDVEEDTVRTLHEARVELLSDPENEGARDRLLACLRKARLRDRYNMDADWMLQLMKDYGPLDWRLPFAHAIYWSSRGDMITKGQINLDENDSMNTVRYIFFGLMLMIKQGKLVLEPDFDDPKRSFIELLPDSRFILPLHEAYLSFGKEQFGNDPRFREGTAGPNYRAGHVTNLEIGISQLYTEGGPDNVALAKELYAYLREYNPDPDTGRVQERYLQPLEQFVFKDFKTSLTSFKNATALIGAWIQQSLKQLSLGEIEQAAAALDRAKQGWMYYMEDKRVEPGQTKRRSLPPFPTMVADTVVQFMQRPDYYVLHKARLWEKLDLSIRQRAYDKLAPFFIELCARQQPPFNVSKAFPEPPGMEEYRKNAPEDDFIPDEGISHGERG